METVAVSSDKEMVEDVPTLTPVTVAGSRAGGRLYAGRPRP